MATEVIHEHDQAASNSSGGMGFLLGAVLLVVILVILFYWGLPALKGASSGTQINVPDKINVNVNQPK